MKQSAVDSEKVKDIQVTNRNLDIALANASKLVDPSEEPNLKCIT